MSLSTSAPVRAGIAVRVLLLVTAMLAVGADAHAQARVVKTPAAILSAPKGSAIGSVRPGTELRVLETRGPYARVSVSGFVERSRISAQRGSSTRRVGNRIATLRARGASGARTVASLDAGTAVTVGSGAARSGWVRVSRTGWVLRSALAAPAATPTPRSVAKAPARTDTKARTAPAKTTAKASAKAATPTRRSTAAEPRVESKASAGDVERPAPRAESAASNGTRAAVVAGWSTTAPLASIAGGAAVASAASSTPSATALSGAPLSDSALVPTANVALRAAPNARALATIAQGTPMIPLARDRGWVRVRVEGWVPERDLAPADSSVRSDVSAADLRTDPQGSRGKVVRWEVQVLARQTADALRRDLAENETYLLARGPGDENALLYLVIPPSLLESTKSISTLADVMITARVRTGKSTLVGVPILDLLTITPRK
jgi:hypothetical protein